MVLQILENIFSSSLPRQTKEDRWFVDQVPKKGDTTLLGDRETKNKNWLLVLKTKEQRWHAN